MEPERVGRGRVAVVTGARQGLGRVVAQHLAGQGYALALLDIGASAETEESVRVQGVPVLSSRSTWPMRPGCGRPPTGSWVASARSRSW